MSTNDKTDRYVNRVIKFNRSIRVIRIPPTSFTQKFFDGLKSDTKDPKIYDPEYNIVENDDVSSFSTTLQYWKHKYFENVDELLKSTQLCQNLNDPNQRSFNTDVSISTNPLQDWKCFENIRCHDLNEHLFINDESSPTQSSQPWKCFENIQCHDLNEHPFDHDPFFFDGKDETASFSVTFYVSDDEYISDDDISFMNEKSFRKTLKNLRKFNINNCDIEISDPEIYFLIPTDKFEDFKKNLIRV